MDTVKYNSEPEQNSLLEEPQLISMPSCSYPTFLLKKMIIGTILLDIYIDDKGRVENVEVVQKVHPVLDSLARGSALRFLFIPAKEMGKPIPVVIRFEYMFEISHILSNITSTPNFSGRVIDAETEKPFCNIPVVCAFIDTTLDTAITIPFGDYIKLISSVKGQYYVDGKLITRTDSLGYFRFFILPVCSLKVKIQPPFHKNFITNETIVPGKVTKTVYKLDALSGLPSESDYEIVVYGKKSTQEKINVVETELQYGLTDDINKIIFVKSTANQIPERGSSIIIHGGGIYDNNYVISDIPVFPPSHFTNYPTLDISGILVATLEDISIITSKIGGRYSNAPGCVVSMKPGIYRSKNQKLIKRRELVANVSTRKIDLSLSTPLRKEKDLYQISYTLADEGFLMLWENSYRTNDFGFAPPKYYGDLNITGISKFKYMDINSFLWFAWDSYYKSQYYGEYNIPWGVGSISFESANCQPLHRAVVGGSSQHYYEGKRIGITSPIKVIQRENATVFLESKSIPLGPFLFDCSNRLEYLLWHGSIDKRYWDTATGCATASLLTRAGSEIHLQGHAGIMYKNDIISFGSDVLVGTITRYKNIFIDPGLWCLIPHDGGSIGFNTGIVSSFPDIRGIPDESYRSSINKTYMATSCLEHTFLNQVITISLEPYIRWRDRCPSFSYDYLYPIWNDTLATPLYSSGINCRLSFIIDDIFNFNVAGTIGKTYRIVNDKRVTYEWDIPWSIKPFFTFHFFKNRMHLFLNSIFSAGFPYRDIVDNNMLKRADIYIRPDIQCEYHSQNIMHSNITRYDLYLGIQNFLRFKNKVEPYWDYSMNMEWVQLAPLTIYIGGRFTFRM